MDLSKMSDAQFLVHTHERRFDFGEAAVFREEFHRRLADSNTMNAALAADRDLLTTRLRAAEARAEAAEKQLAEVDTFVFSGNGTFWGVVEMRRAARNTKE